jgi:hypothetical protein
MISVVDHGFEPKSGQAKDYKISICCFSAKHSAFRRKSKDLLAPNQDNVSEWGYMSIWARQLFRRIQEPMEIFQQQPRLLEGSDAKKIIKNYNKLAKCLLEFEVLYHRGWLRQVYI